MLISSSLFQLMMTEHKKVRVLETCSRWQEFARTEVCISLYVELQMSSAVGTANVEPDIASGDQGEETDETQSPDSVHMWPAGKRGSHTPFLLALHKQFVFLGCFNLALKVFKLPVKMNFIIETLNFV